MILEVTAVAVIKVITMYVSKALSKAISKAFDEVKATAAQAVSSLLSVSAFLAAWASTAAYAVGDLPGGPAVRQYNLHPAVTKVAEDQAWLHWFMMGICVFIFVAVFGVMFYSI